MAGNDLPTLDLGGGASVPGVADGTAPRGSGLAELADGAAAFAAKMGQKADEIHVQDATKQAIGDVQAGTIKGGTTDLTAFGHAYRTVTRQLAGAQLTAAQSEQMGQALLNNRDNPDGLQKALVAVRAGMKPPPGFPELGATLDMAWAREHGDLMNKARAGQLAATIDAAKANGLQLVDTLQSDLVRYASTLPLDAAGNAKFEDRHKAAVAQLIHSGPKTAFDLDGVHYAADDSRSEAWEAVDLAKLSSGLKSQARQHQIEAVFQTIPTSADQHRVMGELRQRYRDGDPALSGISPEDFDRVSNKMDAMTNAKETDERADHIQKMDTARNMMTAYQVDPTSVPSADMVKAAEATGDVGLVAQAKFYQQTGGLGNPGGGGGGPADMTDFIMHDLENNAKPIIDANGAWVKYGVNQKAHPEIADVRNLTEADAKAIYVKDYYQASGAANYPKSMALQIYDAAIVHGVAKAKQWTIQSGGNVGRFVDLRHQEMLRLAHDNPAVYGPRLKGWENRLKKLVGMSAALGGGAGEDAAFAGMNGSSGPPIMDQEGAASDPLKFAMGTPNGSRPPLVTNMPVLDPLGAMQPQGSQQFKDWAAGLQRRSAIGDSLWAAHRLPSRMLFNGEREIYQQALAKQPSLAIPLATAATTALGPEKANRFMQELLAGANNSTALQAIHIAEMRVRNPGSTFADAAARGMDLQSQGAKVVPFDKKRGNGRDFDDATRDLGPAFRQVPSLMVAARGAAESARIALSATGEEHTADWYLQSALGAHNRNGQDYGGVVALNGAMVMIPTWLRQDKLDNALRAAAVHWQGSDNAPVYSNGNKVPPAVLARMQLQLMPDGAYRLINPATGNPMMTKNRVEFRWDPERARTGWLRREVPGAVLGGF